MIMIHSMASNLLDTATDNCDGDLTESVSFGSLDRDLEKQKIHYSVSDSSGNLSETDLLVVIDENLPAEDQAEEGEEGETGENDPVPTESPHRQTFSTNTPPTPMQNKNEKKKGMKWWHGVQHVLFIIMTNGSITESCEWVGPWEEY